MVLPKKGRLGAARRMEARVAHRDAVEELRPAIPVAGLYAHQVIRVVKDAAAAAHCFDVIPPSDRVQGTRGKMILSQPACRIGPTNLTRRRPGAAN